MTLPPPSSVHPVGEHAILADYDTTADVLAAADAVRAAAPVGLVDLVPAERTLLLIGSSSADVPEFRTLIEHLEPAPGTTRSTPELTIDAVYDGEDLEEVASNLGISRDGLVHAHAEAVWVAAFGGFAPGFAYLLPDGELASEDSSDPPGRMSTTGRASGKRGKAPGRRATTTPPPWEVPRRAEPRTQVPTGSIALASRYCGIYPTSSPGGWQLIGRTDAALWDPSRTSPALIGPGSRVRFHPVRARARAAERAHPDTGGPASRPRGSGARAATTTPALTILSVGPQALIQDGGRPGHGSLGVSPSGAADRGALTRANLAVGNHPHAAAIEALLGPLRLRAERDLVLAIAGATAPLQVTRTDGDVFRIGPEHPLPVDRGDVVTIGPASSGLRIVLAVRGGVLEPGAQVLDSLSRDTLGRQGPAPLEAGTVLGVGPATGLDALPTPGAAEEETQPAAEPSDRLELAILPGPRADLLGAAALDALTGTTWTVRQDSDRVGVRLDGDPLPVPAGADSLPSEGMAPGAVQVPPSGLPVVFGRDHPPTGGYPVIGVVTEPGIDALAQATPGTHVRFSIRD